MAKLKKNCQKCNKIFYVRKGMERIHFCSYRCYWDSMKGEIRLERRKRVKITCQMEVI